MTNEAKELIEDLKFYYEVDLNNCKMSNEDWIIELANALTDKNYLKQLMEEIKEYKEQRK